MKMLILSLLASAFISSNAFAIHAYRSEHCVAVSHELDYLGNYPFGGNYGMSLPGQENYIISLPLENEGEPTTTLDEAEVVFTQNDYKITQDSGVIEDCDFDHREWKSTSTIEINLISAEASKTLGLKAGDKISFICEETTDFPNGNSCEVSED